MVCLTLACTGAQKAGGKIGWCAPVFSCARLFRPVKPGVLRERKQPRRGERRGCTRQRKRPLAGEPRRSLLHDCKFYCSTKKRIKYFL